MTQKAITLHKIPLTVILKDDGTVDLTCDVPTILAEHDGDALKLTHQPPQPKETRHQYCYTIANPRATAEHVYYTSVFSGLDPEELQPWPQEKGVSQSPVFDLAPGEIEHVVSVVVLAERRAAAVPARAGVNVKARTLAAAPKPYAGRRHVKSDFQGGDDDL